MIRVRKSVDTPPSLSAVNCKRYDGQDVQDTLYTDHNGKCYLCEQRTGKSFQIEHLKPKSEGFFPELEFDWSNLFLACPYCNGRKPQFKNLLNPSTNNIEEIIEQRIDFSKTKYQVEFRNNDKTEPVTQTIQLLEILLNGKAGIRDVKAEILYKEIEDRMTIFMELLIKFKSDPSATNRQPVIDSLHISKEFLAFKYWILKDYDILFEEFKEYMVWNKLVS